MMKTVKLISVILLASVLGACATTGDKNTANGAATDDQSVKSSGIGRDGQFAGSSASQQALLAQKTILFDFDQTDVTGNYINVVQAHAAYLQNNPQQVVLLAGNTDSRGSREYNMGLGERRASSVANMLLAGGVKSAQLINVSYGPEVPTACGQDEAAYAQNRRVDIIYCQTKDCSTVAKNYARQTLCHHSS